MSTIEELHERHFAAGRKYWESQADFTYYNVKHTYVSCGVKAYPEGRSRKVLLTLLSLRQTPSWRNTLGLPAKLKAKGITVLPWETTEQ